MTNIIPGAAINLRGTPKELMRIYLQVFLSQENLTKKQLDVTTELAHKYSEYIAGGVKEPYASSLLFSSETRKEIAVGMGMSVVHLNNTFKALGNKNVMVLDGGRYTFNPNIVLREFLTFKFIVDEESGEGSEGSSQENRPPEEESKGSVGHADVHDTTSSEEQRAPDVLPEKPRVLPISSSEEYDEVSTTGEKNENGLPFLDTSGGTF